MKIKRFFAADIRQAMRMVRDELGADAVILSNRSVDGGVEIVAARDFDEQLIQNKAQKPAASEPVKLTEAAPKNYEMPDFEAEKKHLHIISSERKKSADPALETRPMRRSTDQYVGYAEKVHLRTSQVSQAITAEPPKDLKIGLTGSAKPQEDSDAGFSGKLLMDMSKELKYLRTLLDGRLLELNSANKDNSVKSELLQRLGGMGISTKLSAKIAERLGNQADVESAFSKAQDMLVKVLPVVEGNLLDAGGIFALVGPTGVGKTTSVAKMAAKFILKHGSRQVALITTDNYRIGAYEQLNTYGRILGIPVRVASSPIELRNLIHEFADKRLVLIDTAGMSQRSMKLTEQINTLQQSNIAVNTCLVMSAATEYRAMNQIIEAFQVFEPQAGILTKLDEAVSIGSALSSVIEYNLPLAFIADGQQVPEDIHRASARALINQCVTDAITESNYTDDDGAQTWMAQSYA
ncbi:MAG: flagellar biosynthesis protein FlhF [Methylobacter sp.]|nr:MAG: flagellar biosynthesis protein FlhF [Methylobacter sp.]